MMVLSYLLRLACLVAVTIGLLQVAFEFLLALAAPVLLRMGAALSLRQRERALYLVQLVPLGLALLFSGFLCRQYIANETNFASEGVGWPCVVVSAAFLCWWLAAAFDGVRMVWRTMRFGRACRRADEDGTTTLLNGTEIVVAADAKPRVALVGVLRPFVLISESLLDDGGLPPLALEVVLDHERSHAVQRDNWKILSLHCIPRLGLRVARGRTWMQLWQHSAEWAADEDAVGGSSARALVLAETLVALARCASASDGRLACTSLVWADTDLETRVERLIAGTSGVTARRGSGWTLAVGVLLVAAAVFAAHVVAVAGDIPEQLLHLG